MERRKIKREIDLSGLPKWGKSGRGIEGSTNWEESVGCKVKGFYNDINFEVEIIDYEIKTHTLHLKYLNEDTFTISTGEFTKCGLGKLLGKITSDFKIEIGIRLQDDKRDITIIDRKKEKSPYKEGSYLKYYKYKCNKCGFDGGKHYAVREKMHKDEFWILEDNLFKGNGCVCCNNSPLAIVENINSIYKIDKWMIPIVGEENSKIYSHGSTEKIYPTCPYCGRKKSKKMKICDIYVSNSMRCVCSDKVSYPEKFIHNILEQLKINFITQLSKANFKWCKDYRYDFYFEYNNEIFILETHGNQHYASNSNFKMSLEEVQLNDRLKKELALANGVKSENYIVIDCRKSNLEWIKYNENGVLKSKLNDLFDLSKIDWNKVEEFACSNLVKVTCDLWNNNPELTTFDISNIMKISETTVLRYSRIGQKLNWHIPNAEIRKINGSTIRLIRRTSSKPIEVFKDGISLGIFCSCVELDKQSEDLFGIKLLKSKISKVCTGKLESYNGFTFEYIEEKLKNII